MELNIKIRQESRHRSVVEMIERTKLISHHGNGIRQNTANINL